MPFGSDRKTSTSCWMTDNCRPRPSANPKRVGTKAITPTTTSPTRGGWAPPPADTSHGAPAGRSQQRVATEGWSRSQNSLSDFEEPDMSVTTTTAPELTTEQVQK